MKNKRKSTNKELVTELEALNTSGQYDKIIKIAKENGYHDFKHTEHHPDHEPKSRLVSDLVKFPELKQFVNDVIEGQYDESPDEGDKKQMRAELLESGANKGMLMALGLYECTCSKKLSQCDNTCMF